MITWNRDKMQQKERNHVWKKDFCFTGKMDGGIVLAEDWANYSGSGSLFLWYPQYSPADRHYRGRSHRADASCGTLAWIFPGLSYACAGRGLLSAGFQISGREIYQDLRNFNPKRFAFLQGVGMFSAHAAGSVSLSPGGSPAGRNVCGNWRRNHCASGRLQRRG